MVFGAIEGETCGLWRSDVFCRMLLASTVNVDVEPLRCHVVREGIFTCPIVVVPNDGMPVTVVLVLQLKHEPDHVSILGVETESSPNPVCDCGGELPIVFPWLFSHSSRVVV